MGESFDVWREFFRTTDAADVFEFIDKAIMIAAVDCPKDFLSQRGRILERLYSCETTRAGRDCTRPTKESKSNSNMGDVVHDVVSIKSSHGEAEAFSDIEETSEFVGQVLRIKQVLDNHRHESDSTLHESLRRLQSMSITVNILEKTKIGISINNLRRNCRSKQIAQLAHNITMGWKAMFEEICRSTEDVADPHKVGEGKTSFIKNQSIREQRQEKYDFNQASSLANRNRRLNVNQHQGTVKSNISLNTNSRTIPASGIASQKFAKERMLQSQDSNGSVAGCKRPLASQQEKIKGWNELVADIKFAATKRKMQELYQKVDKDKRRRIVQVLDLHDLPKMATSRKAPCAATRKARRRRVVLHGRVSCV